MISIDVFPRALFTYILMYDRYIKKNIRAKLQCLAEILDNPKDTWCRMVGLKVILCVIVAIVGANATGIFCILHFLVKLIIFSTQYLIRYDTFIGCGFGYDGALGKQN